MKATKVLLIDDDRSSRRGIAGYLRDVAGFKVDERASGQAALEHLAIHEEEYQVVLLDWVLDSPETNGTFVLEQIGTKYPHLPVIVFTGAVSDAGAKAIELGAYRYLLKPIDPIELVNTIRSLAEQDAALRNLAVTLRQILGADMCLVWRLNRRDKRFRMVAWDGNHDLDSAEMGIELDADDPVLVGILTEGEPHFLIDVQKSSRYRHPNYAVRHGWTSLVTIPLLHRGRVIGLLDGYFCQRREYRKEQSQRENAMLRAYADQAAEAIYATELFRQSQSLTEIDSLLNESFNLGHILQVVLRKGIDLVGADAGWLYLLDREKQELILAESGDKDATGAPECYRLDDSIVGQVVRESSAKIIVDSQVSSLSTSLPIAGAQSQIVVPLRREDQSIGALVATSHYSNAFFNDDVRLLSSLAQKATLAINRAKLTGYYHELSQPPHYSREEFAEKVVKAVHDLTGRSVSLWLWDRKDGCLRIAAMRGVPDEYHTLGPIKIDDEALASYALRTGEVVNRKDILDTTLEPSLKYQTTAKNAGWRSALIVPLFTSEGHPLGTMHLYGRTKGQFGSVEVDFVRGFANQVAAISENAQLYSDQKDRADILTNLNETSKSFIEKTDLRSVLDEVAESAQSLLGGDAVILYEYDAPKQDLVFPPTYRGVNFPEYLHERGEFHQSSVAMQMAKGALQAQYLQDTEEVKRGQVQHSSVRPNFVQRENIKSSARIRLEAMGKTVGVLFVNYRSHHVFDETEKKSFELFANFAAVAIERTRLHEYSSQQANALREIVEIVAAIGPESDPLPTILRKVVDLFKADYGSFSFVDPDARQLVFQAIWEKDRLLTGEQIPVEKRVQSWDKGITGFVARDWRRAYRVGNVRKDAHYQPWYEESNSELVVPLIENGKTPVGVLNLESSKPDAFSLTDENLCQNLANIALMAIEKDRLFDTIQLFNEQLDRLHQISQRQTLEQVFQNVLNSINAIMGEGSSAALELYDTGLEEGTMYPAAGPMKEYLLGMPPRSSGTARHVIKTKRPLYLDDVLNPPQHTPTVRPESIAQGVKSFAALPIRGQERIVGMLFVNLQKQIAFSQEVQRILELFANHTAIAIENTLLFGRLNASNAQLERRVTELDALVQIGRVVSNAGMNEVLEIVHDEAERLMDARNLYIALYDEEADEVSFPLAYSDGAKIKIGSGPWSSRRRAQPLNAGEQRKQGEPRYGLTEYVIDHPQGETSIGDVWEWAKERDIELSLDIPTKSWIGAPLKVWNPVNRKERIVGVISIQSHEKEDAYSEDDLRVLELMASQAAVAIENTSLYGEMDRLIENRTTQLLNARRQLEASERLSLLNQVGAVFAHRINNMTGTIESRTNYVRRFLLTIVGKDHKAVRMLDGIAGDIELLMEASAELKGTATPSQPAILEIPSLIDDALDRVSSTRVDFDEIQVNKSIDTSLPNVLADRSALADVLENLIRNAVDAMSSGGILGVAATSVQHEAHRYVEIRISDSGGGIPQEDIPHLFDLFHSTKEKGLGFGLSQGQLYIRSIGGKIEVTSEVGEGSTFTILLPAD